MILTVEDISVIEMALDKRFSKIEHQISDLTHLSNKRFTAIELRLDAIEYKLQQIAVVVPFENAFLSRQ